jgi:uncharacterized protein (DUF305 family)
MTRRILAPLLLLAAVLLPAARPSEAQGHTASHPHSMPGMAAMPSMTRLEAASGKTFEVAFLSEMIEHHGGAVRMAEQAAPKLRRPPVKRAARKIAAAQKKEIAQMTAWLKAWYGRKPDPGLRAAMKADMAPMMAAFQQECVADCDRAFLTHMKPHHQMAIDMAQLALKKSVHPQLRRMARQIMTAQAKEIAQFNAWLNTTKQ